jgi:hypothetical protein
MALSAMQRVAITGHSDGQVEHQKTMDDIVLRVKRVSDLIG